MMLSSPTHCGSQAERAAAAAAGSESPERVAQLRARFGKPVWKALPVASASDVARAAAYAGAADWILLVSLEIGNFCTLSALFNQSWFVRG
ncbi:hypothetical protein [Enterobacter kobei]|uniref:hypothetical protein n=1 Tax=Enterobacter kobei TaxID=208224 RepID=UPI0038906179